MNIFLNHVSQTFSDYFLVMQVDQASWHFSKSLVITENIRLMKQSPYSPELNPVEHIWDDIREKIFIWHWFWPSYSSEKWQKKRRSAVFWIGCRKGKNDWGSNSIGPRDFRWIRPIAKHWPIAIYCILCEQKVLRGEFRMISFYVRKLRF